MRICLNSAAYIEEKRVFLVKVKIIILMVYISNYQVYTTEPESFQIYYKWDGFVGLDFL